MSIATDIFERVIIGKNSPTVGEFSVPWSQQQFSDQQQIFSLAPKWKQIIDQEARVKFLEGVSSTALAQKLSEQYHKLIAGVVVECGLYAHLKEFGITPLVVGGLARGNSGVRSDHDLVLWGNNQQLAALANTFKGQERPHEGFRLLSDLTLNGISISRPLRSATDLPAHLRSGDIDVITALLSVKPLVVGDTDFLSAQKEIHQFVQENRSQILTQIGRSIIDRVRAYGAIFTLAEFNLKESLGGLRDDDAVSWLENVQRICEQAETIISPKNTETLLNTSEVLYKAKHAWHFTQEVPTLPYDGFNGKALQSGLRCPVDKVNYVGYGGRRKEFCRLLSDSLGGLLHERDVDEMIYRAAILNARIINQVVLPFCGYANQSSEHSLRSELTLISKRHFADHLGDSGEVSPFVRQLFQSGDLGKLFADFRYAEPFVDRAGFHQFSLGEHHVQTLERVEHYVKNGRSIYPELGDLSIVDPAPLYLAALVHDLAKPDEGENKDHASKGAAIAKKIATEIGFSAFQIERSTNLVHDHMIIADLSAGFNIHIDNQQLLERLQNPAYLGELLILTLADKYASNPQHWAPSKELWIFAAYAQLQQTLYGEQSFVSRTLSHVFESLGMLGPVSYAAAIEKFVSEIDTRILSHYSPSVLAKQVSVLEKVRAYDLCQEDPFEFEMIEVSGGRPLYHLVFSCLDKPGLFGRVNQFLYERNMRLTSAYVHTTDDGFVCDYLTLEPKMSDHKFLADDLSRFSAALKRAALVTSDATLDVGISTSRKKNTTFSEARFVDPVDIYIEPEIAHNRIMLTISGKIQDDMIGKISPLLQFENLNIIGAKLRTGNRQQRYVLYLDSFKYDISRFSQLESQVREALGQ